MNRIARELILISKLLMGYKVPADIKKDLFKSIEDFLNSGMKAFPERTEEDKHMREVYKEDAMDLKEVLQSLRQNKVNEAFSKAQQLDTNIRDSIPKSVWKYMENFEGEDAVGNEKEKSSNPWKKKVLVYLRNGLGAPKNAKLVYESYLEETRGTSNKFHYFAVLEYKEDGQKTWVGGNAYGRIGKNPRVIEIGIELDKNEILSKVKKKEKAKLSKGYQKK